MSERFYSADPPGVWGHATSLLHVLRGSRDLQHLYGLPKVFPLMGKAREEVLEFQMARVYFASQTEYFAGLSRITEAVERAREQTKNRPFRSREIT